MKTYVRKLASPRNLSLPCTSPMNVCCTKSSAASSILLRKNRYTASKYRANSSRPAASSPPLQASRSSKSPRTASATTTILSHELGAGEIAELGERGEPLLHLCGIEPADPLVREPLHAEARQGRAEDHRRAQLVPA